MNAATPQVIDDFVFLSASYNTGALLLRIRKDGADEVLPMKPNTIARSLAIGNPADGMFALQVSRSTGGAIDWCTEEEIVEGLRLLAETEGVFTETAGGVTVANLKRLVDQGVIEPDEETVLFITGNGYKTIKAVAGTVGQPFLINARLQEFDALYRSLTPPAPTREGEAGLH